ncbi:MAG: c-type cytochrome [Prevotella sp.]|nr:c-type cytochrome [Prevotella sp.]
MKTCYITSRIILGMMVGWAVLSCTDDDADDKTISTIGEDDYKYIGQECGNFQPEEWYPGGVLGTTENVGSTCYEDETPAVQQADLVSAFKFGEMLFEHDFTETSTSSFSGLGPAYVRTSCIHCHPGYGHGKRVESYRADYRGNGYLLVFYHPADGLNSDDGPYISEVTGMPQTKAVKPFLPPVNEDQLNLQWLTVSEAEMQASSGLSLTFPDGEKYTLSYPDLSFRGDLAAAFNTDPVPTNVACRLESTIGLYGTGLLDAIPEDSLKAEYARQAASHRQAGRDVKEYLNPNFWDAEKDDWAGDPSLGVANGAWYKLADGRMKIKRFTYAMTRASLQDGAGANAMWNIPNVSRSDRHFLYTTTAWANAMSKNSSVIAAIKADPASPYYNDGTDEGISEAVKTLLDPSTDQFSNAYHNFKPEMSDQNFWQFMVWHRGLAVPRARDLNDAQVQRGKKLFAQMGCTECHRPRWQTGSDDYWAPSPIVNNNLSLPTYPHQTIYPYTDMLQHRLYMKNGIHGSWCRTTPLWGRGLSLANTGAEDRLHDCRAKNEVEAIMWHAYSKNSDAYWSARQFYYLTKEERDAVVKFLKSI